MQNMSKIFALIEFYILSKRRADQSTKFINKNIDEKTMMNEINF